MEALNTLFDREMDRKEFLSMLVILLVTLTGITGIIKSLTNPRLFQTNRKTNGFGTGPYGI